MHTILIVNSKGGSGKTTISTNLASYYASIGRKTALMDYDPQGSSLHWLKKRPDAKPVIHGANAAHKHKNTIRSWQMKIPADIEKLIIDAPAGACGILLQEMVRKTSCIVIPVSPSSIDIHATADFIKDLFLLGKARQSDTRIAIVANRARNNMALYSPLEKFLNSLDIPFVTTLSDSENYIYAAEQGLGIFEAEANNIEAQRQEFTALIDWIEKTNVVRRNLATPTQQQTIKPFRLHSVGNKPSRY